MAAFLQSREGFYAMCGIAGVLHLDGRPADRSLLREMVARLRHRGPDAQEIATDRHMGLAHTRLSIIDLAHGQQPMQSDDGTLLLSFNGEIFNYVELRESLTSKGHRFRTDSDTEVILHAFREYGTRCVDHFNGQWAFAIWEGDKQRLFLSRDRFGIRPLFYTQTGSSFLFASEVKALLCDADVDRQLDPRGLHQLFTLWTTIPPRTVFRDVLELPPGHNLVAQKDHVDVQPYWQLDFSPTRQFQTSSQLREELMSLLDDATRLRMRADVPVGAYLSGGLDSSVTAALSQRHTRDRLRTFSVTFPQREFDESRFQQQVVQQLDTDHRAVQCTPRAIAAVFPSVVRHAEKPLLRTAAAPLYLLSQQVRQSGLKVVLTGEGADEMLGGYDIFKEAKVRRFCARGPRSSWRASLFTRLYPYLPQLQAQSPAYLQAFFHARREDLSQTYFSHAPRWEMTSQIQRMFHPDFAAGMCDEALEADLKQLLPGNYDRWPALCQAQFLETALLMPGYILSSQGDRVALAHGVEGRFPFLDHRLAEFAASLPPRWKMHGLDEKHLLKQAVKEIVPAEVVGRTKQPYRAPDADSFFAPDSGQVRDDYVEDLLEPDSLRESGIFRSDAAQRLAAKARAGKVTSTKDNMALVGILSTELLARQCLPQWAPQAAAQAGFPAVTCTSPHCDTLPL